VIALRLTIVDEFPFSKAEWDAVSDAAFPIVNATIADDAALRDSLLIELQEVLATLRNRHGDHPVLLETEADYADNTQERLRLYRRAIVVAELNELPTLTIRLSVAQLLIDTGDRDKALEELIACQGETKTADSYYAGEWSRLRAELQDARR
jgi:hypothetical protein